MNNLPEFGLIVACDQNRGIGINNQLPWHLPGDLKYFAKVTTQTADPTRQNAVIMGRKTWESIPEAHRPLKGRLNIVLTTDPDYLLPQEVFMANSLDQALQIAADHNSETVFNIGGSQIFALGMNHPNFKFAHITEIDATFNCDTFLPILPLGFTKTEIHNPVNENELTYTFTKYERG